MLGDAAVIFLHVEHIKLDFKSDYDILWFRLIKLLPTGVGIDHAFNFKAHFLPTVYFLVVIPYYNVSSHRSLITYD